MIAKNSAPKCCFEIFIKALANASAFIFQNNLSRPRRLYCNIHENSQCTLFLNYITLSSFSFKCKISYFCFSGVSFSSKFSGMLCEHLLTGHNFSASVVWTMILKHSSLQILCPHGNKTGGEESKSLSQLTHLPNFLQYIHAFRIILTK